MVFQSGYLWPIIMINSLGFVTTTLDYLIPGGKGWGWFGGAAADATTKNAIHPREGGNFSR